MVVTVSVSGSGSMSVAQDDARATHACKSCHHNGHDNFRAVSSIPGADGISYGRGEHLKI